jgi:septum formation protein
VKNKKKHIILASKSPRRKEIIAGMGLNFSVEPANIGDENRFFEETGDIEAAIIALAQAKNKPVAEKFPDLPVLSADTIVVINGKVLGKPKDRDDAKKILNMLSGKKHSVFTAVNLVCKNSGFDETILEKTDVWFREIDDFELEEYLDTANYLDKAGAYGIQDKGLYFVEKIDGCYSNVVGLPISAVITLLKSL